MRYFPLRSLGVQTPFGPVDFRAGRLTFANMRLARGYRAVEEAPSGPDPRNIHRGSYTQHESKTLPAGGPGEGAGPDESADWSEGDWIDGIHLKRDWVFN